MSYHDEYDPDLHGQLEIIPQPVHLGVAIAVTMLFVATAGTALYAVWALLALAVAP